LGDTHYGLLGAEVPTKFLFFNWLIGLLAKTDFG